MSTLVETVFNTPTLSGQVAGTNSIHLKASLSVASADLVAYMTETRASIASIDTSIDDYQYRIGVLEASTDVVESIARFNSIDQSLANLNTQLTTEVAGLVSLSGNQSIAGHKIFTGDITVEGTTIINDAIIKTSGELDVGNARLLLNSEEIGAPSVNAGIEVERGSETNAQMLWNEATDQWEAGLEGALEPVALQQYVTDNALSINGGVLRGNLEVSNNGQTAITVETDDDLQAGFLTYRFADDKLGAHIYRTPPGLDPSIDAGELRIRNYDVFGGGVVSEMVWRDGIITSNVPISAPSPTSASSLTTREFVESTFVNVGATQTVSGRKTFSTDVTVDTAGNPGYLIERSGVLSAGFFGLESYAMLRRNVESGPHTELHLLDNVLRVNKPMEGIDSTEPDSFTTRGYVDDNFLNVNTGALQTITSPLRCQNSIEGINLIEVESANTATMRIGTTGVTGNQFLDFSANGVRSALIYRTAIGTGTADIGALRLRNYDTISNAVTTEMVLTQTFCSFNCPVSIPDATLPQHAVRRDFVEAQIAALDARIAALENP